MEETLSKKLSISKTNLFKILNNIHFFFGMSAKNDFYEHNKMAGHLMYMCFRCCFKILSCLIQYFVTLINSSTE